MPSNTDPKDTAQAQWPPAPTRGDDRPGEATAQPRDRTVTGVSFGAFCLSLLSALLLVAWLVPHHPGLVPEHFGRFGWLADAVDSALWWGDSLNKAMTPLPGIVAYVLAVGAAWQIKHRPFGKFVLVLCVGTAVGCLVGHFLKS